MERLPNIEPATLDEDPAPDAVCNAVLRRFLAEVTSGVEPNREAFCAAFPGYESLVTAEFERLIQSDPSEVPSGGAEGPGPYSQRLGSGVRIGRYLIDGELAAGGMGVVYLATDTSLGRRVVLKTALPSMAIHRDIVRRLRQEAMLAGRLDHPSLCPVLDVVEGDECGRLFIVQPFIPGTTMESVLADTQQFESFLCDFSEQSTLDRGDADTQGTDSQASPASSTVTESSPTPERQAYLLQLVEELARALAHAHDHQVVHRDLKPSNIIVRPDGRPVILDFGLARDMDGETHTADGSTLGTPSYMSPEQVRGDNSEMGPHTDVYALGVILYKMLAGQCPYRGDSREALYHAILEGRPASLRSLVSSVSKDLEAVCLKAMARDPRDRFASAVEFAEELGRISRQEPTLTRPLGPLAKGVRLGRRYPWRSGLAAAVLVLAFGLGIVSVQRWGAGETASIAQFYVAYEEAMDAVREEGRLGFTDGERSRLRELAGDRGDALVLIEDPTDPATLRRIRRSIQTGSRSAESAGSMAWRPLGAIANPHPDFVFSRPEGDLGQGDRLMVHLVSGQKGRILYERDIPVPLDALSSAGLEDLLTVPCPENLTLLPGDYEWVLVVKREGKAGRDVETVARPQRFRVGTQKELDDALPVLTSSFSRDLGIVLEASGLQAAGFAQPALDRLAELSSELDTVLTARVALLRGAIALQLGDRSAARKAFRNARTTSSSSSPSVPTKEH